MTQVHLAAADYLVVAGYFVIVLVIGFYFRNKLDAAKDYFAGANRIPWWLAGISHYMSSFQRVLVHRLCADGVYRFGWVAVTLFWATIPGCVLGSPVCAKCWRRAHHHARAVSGSPLQQLHPATLRVVWHSD